MHVHAPKNNGRAEGPLHDVQKAPCTVVSQTPRPKGQKLTPPVGLGPVRAFWFKPNGQVVVCTVGSLDLATVHGESMARPFVVM